MLAEKIFQDISAQSKTKVWGRFDEMITENREDEDLGTYERPKIDIADLEQEAQTELEFWTNKRLWDMFITKLRSTFPIDGFPVSIQFPGSWSPNSGRLPLSWFKIITNTDSNSGGL